MSLRSIAQRLGSLSLGAVHQATLLKQPPIVTLNRTFASKKHKAILRHAKGFRGRSKNCFRLAIRRVLKGWQYAYRDRKRKKRNWRKLWIQQVQAGARQYAMRYSQLIHGMNVSNIQLNRKVLANMAANEPFAFKSVVDVVRHECQAQKVTL